MANRIIPAAAIAIPCIIILVLLPGVVALTHYPRIARFKANTERSKQFWDFIKDRARDIAGQATIPSSSKSAPATTLSTYLIGLVIGTGTQPQTVYGSLDVSSELVWVPCSASCHDQSSISTCNQAGIFVTGSSQSYWKVPCGSTDCSDFFYPNAAPSCDHTCGYTYKYGAKETSGNVSTEKFDFGGPRVNLTFGCASPNQGDFSGQLGLIGFNRAPMSLVSQLQLERFSYYFAPEDGKSMVYLGDDAMPQTNGPSYTRFLTTDVAITYPHVYFVGLAGIRVGGKSLTFSGASVNGSVAAYLSTSVLVTYLEKNTYDLLKKEITSTVGSNTADGSAFGLDLCYNTAGKNIFPADMALLFVDGAAMQLQPRNYLYRDTTTGLDCLTILPSSSEFSLLGSMIQTGTHIIYDIQGKRLGFESFEPPSSRSSNPPIPTAAAIGCFVVWCALACMFL